MALIKELLEVREERNEIWYNIYSDTIGKAVLQVDTGSIFGCVSARDDDPHEYQETDDPCYVPEEDIEQ